MVSKLWSLIQWALITAATAAVFALSLVSYMPDKHLLIYGGFHPVILIMHTYSESQVLHNYTGDFLFIHLFAFPLKITIAITF